MADSGTFNAPIRPRVYFDHNATTPPADFIAERLGEWLGQWGNPSSIHWAGRGPKALLRDSRKSVAQALRCDPLEIVFTSGGSEANNLAIKGIFEVIESNHGCLPGAPVRDHYLLSAVEHPSVVKAMNQLKAEGARVDVIPVNRQGKIDLEKLESLLSERTALVSVMFANNETGNIFPIKEISRLAHASGALIHCDGVQGLGKAQVNVRDWDVDLATFSGHKVYALKGCGVLYVRKGIQIEPLISGGGQERGRRAGTENLLAIASFGAIAARLHDIELKVEQMTYLRDRMEQLILDRIPGVKLTGAESERICNTSSLIIEGIDGETLLMNLDMRGFSVSTGAACSSGSPEPSPVLIAMGLSRAEAQASLRLSLGWSSTVDEVDAFAAVLTSVVERLRSFRHGAHAMLGV